MSKEMTDAEKEERELVLVRKNAVAIADTLVRHGEVMEELFEARNKLQTEVAQLRLELTAQKQLIVRSLQQTYGHAATA